VAQNLMSGLGLKVTVEDRQLVQTLGELVRRLGSMQPAFEVIGRQMLTSVHHRFETATDPEGHAWKPLAESTKAKRAGRLTTRSKRGIAASAMGALSGKTGFEPLFVTGQLMRQITYKATEQSVSVGSNELFPGGTKSALAIHQLGGDAGRGHAARIPARPSLGFNAEDRKYAIVAIADFLKR
jgi:phage virion morphogenesis protein